MSNEQTRSFELDRAIELAREAFIEAMRDEGISPSTRFTISTRAERNIHESLEYDAEDREIGTGRLVGTSLGEPEH